MTPGERRRRRHADAGERERGQRQRATAALYMVPPVALVAAFARLGERPRPAALLGGVVTIAGVVLINRRSAST